ncbi:signal-regulatory protein beta-2-like [Chaetodon auriga]|uniref:signal-regulatory protein beta-2-like n=1 Tax=Chaetodon auriga TaxID=39042 RepID=UPI004032D927
MLIIFCVVVLFTVGRCTDDQRFVKKTVFLGQDVTLTCSRHSGLGGLLFWIKLAVGNFPEVLAATYTFDNGGIITTPRCTAKTEPGAFVLDITKTELSDTAFYYCEQVTELKTTILNKTFLQVKGPEHIITIIQVPPSGPVRPGDSLSLQCSVFSDSEKKTCPGGLGVYWFRAGSHESHPSVIYAHGNSGDECETSPEARCVYNFFKENISSSDAGTYYCAVATCGQIIFGNGTKLEVEGNTCDSQKVDTVVCLLFAALAISLILVASLLYIIRKKSCDCCKKN